MEHRALVGGSGGVLGQEDSAWISKPRRLRASRLFLAKNTKVAKKWLEILETYMMAARC